MSVVQHQAVTGRAGILFDGYRQPTNKGAGNVGNHQGNRTRSPGAQTAGNTVEPIAKRGDGLSNARLCFSRNAWFAVQHR